MGKKLTPISARFIMNPTLHVAAGTQPFGAVGRIYFSMVVIPWDMIIDRLLFLPGNISTGNVRIGIYREGATIDIPDAGKLMAESGSVAKAVSLLQAITISDTFLKAGRHYVGVMSDQIADDFRHHYSMTPASGGERWTAHAYAAFTDPCPVTNATAVPPIVGVRVKEVLAYAK